MNTWTLFYTTMVYPHALTGGGEPPPENSPGGFILRMSKLYDGMVHAWR